MSQETPTKRSLTIRVPTVGGGTAQIRRAMSWAGRLGRGRTLVALVAVVVVLTIVDVLIVRADTRRSETEDARSEALSAVHARVPAMLSYDHRQLEADLSVASGNATGTFAKEYTSLLEEVVYPNARENKVTTHAQVTGAAVVDAGPDEATILTFLTQSTSSSDAETPNVTGSRVVVTVEKTGEGWFVSGIDTV